MTSTDKAGNKSDVATTEVTDTTAPSVPTVNPVTSDDTTITGKAEPNSTVTVTFPDGTTATGNTDADGNYVIDIPANEDLKVAKHYQLHLQIKLAINLNLRQQW